MKLEGLDQTAGLDRSIGRLLETFGIEIDSTTRRVTVTHVPEPVFGRGGRATVP